MKRVIPFIIMFVLFLVTFAIFDAEAKAWIHGTKQDVDNNHCPAWQDGTPVTIPTVQAYMNSNHPGHGYYTALVQKNLIIIHWAVRGVHKMDFVPIINTCLL